MKSDQNTNDCIGLGAVRTGGISDGIGEGCTTGDWMTAVGEG